MADTQTKQVTSRLKRDLYERGKALADRRHISLNALLQEGLVRLVEEENQVSLDEAYNQLALDEETNVEYALAAQWEVVSGQH